MIRSVGRRVIQGSPGPRRPLRLLPMRARRFADQYSRSYRADSTYNHEDIDQDIDNSFDPC